MWSARIATELEETRNVVMCMGVCLSPIPTAMRKIYVCVCICMGLYFCCYAKCMLDTFLFVACIRVVILAGERIFISQAVLL